MNVLGHSGSLDEFSVPIFVKGSWGLFGRSSSVMGCPGKKVLGFPKGPVIAWDSWRSFGFASHLGCAWGGLGVCLRCAWGVPGVCLGCALGVLGVCLGVLGVCLA